MKSFRQKIEEKKLRLQEERLILEEQARIRWEQEESKRIEKQQEAAWREEEIRLAEQKQLELEQQQYEENIRRQEEQRRQKALQRKQLQEEQEWNRQLESRQQEREHYAEYKRNQKSVLSHILEGERQLREAANEELSKIQNEKAHEIYLHEQEQLQLRLEEKERLQLEEMERIESQQIAEQEKYARWDKISEEIEQEEEQARLVEEQLKLQDKELHDTADMLERIESERAEYDERQRIIAEQEKDQRDQLNKVLLEVQKILASTKQSYSKDKLSNLHDYIYRLNSNVESDPWTNRKQPVAILTWEEWKIVPANEKLIEEDFRRARLLFEQDNMRAKRYYDHMWHWSDARYLTENRNVTQNSDTPFSGIPRYLLIKNRQDLVKDIPGLEVWLDAADTSNMRACSTASVAMTGSNLSVFWDYQSESEAAHNNPNFIAISGSDNIFDYNEATTGSIMNSSGSEDGAYDMNENFRGYTNGIFNLKYDFGADNKQVFKKIRILCQEREFMPVQSKFQMREGSTGGYTVMAVQNALRTTGSTSHTGNSQFPSGEDTGNGGYYGVDANGSGSLDLTIYYPNNETAYQQWIWEIYGLTTGSEMRINSIEFYVSGSELPITHGTPIDQWKSKDPENKTFRKFLAGGNGRQFPYGFAKWYTSSLLGQNLELSETGYFEGIVDMPHIKFTSQSMDCMVTDQYHDFTEFTYVFVCRGTCGKANVQQGLYTDRDTSHRARMLIEAEGFTKGLKMDIQDEIDNVSQTADKIVVHAKGKSFDVLDMNTGEWPWSQQDTNYMTLDHMHGSYVNNQARIYCFQVQRSGSKKLDGTPFVGQTTSSIGRMWVNGGTPIVDTDQQNGNLDFIYTGSYASPTLGARDGERGYNTVASNWGDWEVHEVLQYNRVLTKDEMLTIHDYLYEKWRIPFGSASIDNLNQHDRVILNDAEGDSPVIGLSSSNSSFDAAQDPADGTMNWGVS